MSVAFLLLGLWALRNIAIAPLVGLPVVARLLPEPTQDVPRRRHNLVIIAATLTVGALVTRESLSTPAFDYRDYPVTAMRVLEQRGLLGRRLFTTESWGGYIIHRYWPRQRVFMDDRFDMYPVPFTERYMKARRAQPEWRELFTRYRVDTVLWKTDDPLTEVLLTKPGWRTVHRDRQATIFVRTGGPAT